MRNGRVRPGHLLCRGDFAQPPLSCCALALALAVRAVFSHHRAVFTHHAGDLLSPHGRFPLSRNGRGWRSANARRRERDFDAGGFRHAREPLRRKPLSRLAFARHPLPFRERGHRGARRAHGGDLGRDSSATPALFSWRVRSPLTARAIFFHHTGGFPSPGTGEGGGARMRDAGRGASTREVSTRARTFARGKPLSRLACARHPLPFGERGHRGARRAHGGHSDRDSYATPAHLSPRGRSPHHTSGFLSPRGRSSPTTRAVSPLPERERVAERGCATPGEGLRRGRSRHARAPLRRKPLSRLAFARHPLPFRERGHRGARRAHGGDSGRDSCATSAHLSQRRRPCRSHCRIACCISRQNFPRDLHDRLRACRRQNIRRALTQVCRNGERRLNRFSCVAHFLKTRARSAIARGCILINAVKK